MPRRQPHWTQIFSQNPDQRLRTSYWAGTHSSVQNGRRFIETLTDYYATLDFRSIERSILTVAYRHNNGPLIPVLPPNSPVEAPMKHYALLYKHKTSVDTPVAWFEYYRRRQVLERFKNAHDTLSFTRAPAGYDIRIAEVDAEPGRPDFFIPVSNWVDGKWVDIEQPPFIDTPTIRKAKFMIDLSITRAEGKIRLTIDATQFHAELDALGVPSDDERYLNGPVVERPSPSSRDLVLSPSILLIKGKHTTDLATLAGRPISPSEMKLLGATVKTLAEKILNHYHPITVKVKVRKS